MAKSKYLGINIDKDRDEVLSDQARLLLTKFYCLKGEDSPQQGYARASVAYCLDDLELAQRVYDYASKGWFMFASPVLSNAPLPNEKPKSLPISCFLSYVPDTLEGLIDHTSELRWLSVKGGGVGGHWSDIRSVSDKAPGPIPFQKTVDSDMTAYRQGVTRKGSYAAYMDVSHPDIEEFISIRVPSGDINRKCLNLHNAVNITDEFMDNVRQDKDFNLVDPNSNEIKKVVKARYLWQSILETRLRTGEPYLNFIDTANRFLPQSQKDKGLKINGSNLCNEIHLVTSVARTAVCCLSSVNIEKWEEWKNSSMIEDLIDFLDRVLQFFIENAPPELSKAIYSAKMERALGLGAMGFHSYLQSKMIPFNSDQAKLENKKIFSTIKERAVNKSIELGSLRGEPDDMVGTGFRNSHLLAIAPNANSSIIVNTSPSIEPWAANAFSARTRVGTHLKKNKYLEIYLDDIGMNTQDVWSSIIVNEGSVQHLDFVEDYVKEVFKTAMELDQISLIDMAGDRQKFLCQGQSLNIFLPPKVTKKLLSEVHYHSWKVGCKGLYYLRTKTESRAEIASQKIERNALSSLLGNEIENEECIACQG